MTTKARIAALQWFHDRGEIAWLPLSEYPPSQAMRKKMIADGQLQLRSQGEFKAMLFSLTDKGRQDLHEATK